ncbi:MAG: hypothetical protein NTW04_01595 [Elusimicrobia bacterium]|nr:hypothetical protein [Elusimicrobiota bacterium]
MVSAEQNSGQSLSASYQSVGQKIKTASAKLLEGVEIAQTYSEGEGLGWYALAVMDKAKSAAILKERITEIDFLAAERIKEFEGTTERFPRIKAAFRLKALQTERENLNADLRLLDPSGKGSENKKLLLLKPKILEAAAGLNVVVNVSGTEPGEVASAVVKSLSNFGINARIDAEKDAPRDLEVSANVAVSEYKTTRSRNWKWANASAIISVKDINDGKVFSKFNVADRKASENYPTAVSYAMTVLGEKAAQGITEAITAYFQN